MLKRAELKSKNGDKKAINSAKKSLSLDDIILPEFLS